MLRYYAYKKAVLAKILTRNIYYDCNTVLWRRPSQRDM